MKSPYENNDEFDFAYQKLNGLIDGLSVAIVFHLTSNEAALHGHTYISPKDAVNRLSIDNMGNDIEYILRVTFPWLRLPATYTEQHAAEDQMAARAVSTGEAMDKAAARIRTLIMDQGKYGGSESDAFRRDAFNELQGRYENGLITGDFSDVRNYRSTVVTLYDINNLLSAADLDLDTLPAIRETYRCSVDHRAARRGDVARTMLTRAVREGIPTDVGDIMEMGIMRELRCVRNAIRKDLTVEPFRRRLLEATGGYLTIHRLTFEHGVDEHIAQNMVVHTAANNIPFDADTAVDTFHAAKELPAELANALYGAAVFTWLPYSLGTLNIPEAS